MGDNRRLVLWCGMRLEVSDLRPPKVTRLVLGRWLPGSVLGAECFLGALN